MRYGINDNYLFSYMIFAGEVHSFIRESWRIFANMGSNTNKVTDLIRGVKMFVRPRDLNLVAEQLTGIVPTIM